MLLLLLFFAEESSWTSSITPGWILAVLTILVLVFVAIILLLSKNKEFVQLVDKESAKSNAELAKVRGDLLEECKKECDECGTELADVTAEYRAVASIVLRDLIAWWKVYEEREAYILQLEEKIRIYEKREHLDQKKK